MVRYDFLPLNTWFPVGFQWFPHGFHAALSTNSMVSWWFPYGFHWFLRQMDFSHGKNKEEFSYGTTEFNFRVLGQVSEPRSHHGYTQARSWRPPGEPHWLFRKRFRALLQVSTRKTITWRTDQWAK